MIHLTYSNRTEALLDALVRRLAARRGQADPLAPVRLVVPNRNVERYVELGVARRLGIAANLRFERLGGLLRDWLGDDLLLEDAMLARVFRALGDPALVSDPALAPVRRYLEGAGDAREVVAARRAQLAAHLARLFEEYGYARPELLRAWTAGETRFGAGRQAEVEAWQRALWRWLRVELPPARTLQEALASAPAPPGELHVFGLSYVARAFAAVFERLGAAGALHLYALNPCEEFWEDLETAAELRRRRRASDVEPEWLFEDEDPFDLSVDTETPLLRLWGRPGREHVRLLGALTECDFTPAFVDPSPAPAPEVDPSLPLFAGLAAPPLLARIQRDILRRAPRGAPDPDARVDPSLKVLACPSVRREVEAVAAEIWRAIDEVDGLTFDRVAVLVNGPDRELYLPHVGAVFERARQIPFNVTDLSLASVSPLVEAALALLELPSTGFTRADVLTVVTHPAVVGAVPNVDPSDWVGIAERLGVFRGLDVEALEGTYAEGADRLHWEQGLSRLALGAFMDADAGEVAIGERRLRPEAPLSDGAAEGAFARLVRSLMSDVRFAREATLSLTEWSRFFSAMVQAYLHASSDREEAAHRRVVRALASLARLDLDGAPVPYAGALELARGPIAELAGSRGEHLANGVAVSSLLPMRAIPFRVVFVLGLGEGRFPATDRRDSMDLRAARRQAGDVTPSERDRYTFLETVLCARERLVLSYVARDERTGDALSPSAVVTELLEVIEEGYLPDARGRLVRPVPLRRAEDAAVAQVLAEAERERRAQALGESLRASLGADARALDAVGPARTSRQVERDPRLSRTLGLRPLPAPSHTAPRGEVARLSLAALRRFLDCPMQGWTRAVLRLDDEPREAPEAASEEPFAPSRLDAASVLRGAFADAALGLSDVDAAYAARALALEAQGRWPLGALRDQLAAAHGEVLARWGASWRALGEATSVRRVRLGAARRGDPSEEVRDALTLELPTGGRVELVGRTELLREGAGERGSVNPLERRPDGERGRAHVLRWALRAFFDHAALSASGGAGQAHRSLQLYADRDGGRVEAITFAPLGEGEARAWLAGVAADLLAGQHAYLFPVESVLRVADRWPQVRGSELVDSVAFVRDRWGGGQSRWGPVRDPLGYPLPDARDALAMATRRFGLPLAGMRGTA